MEFSHELQHPGTKLTKKRDVKVASARVAGATAVLSIFLGQLLVDANQVCEQILTTVGRSQANQVTLQSLVPFGTLLS